jgi:hypothetical protein
MNELTEQDLKPLLDATEVVGRAKAKQELLERLNAVGMDDLYRPVKASELLTEVFVWIRESDVDKAKKAKKAD